MTDAAVNPLKAGLEDVVVSPSEICFIDGRKGRLIYRGYDVDDLVAHSTFEEVTFLLWQGRRVVGEVAEEVPKVLLLATLDQESRDVHVHVHTEMPIGHARINVSGIIQPEEGRLNRRE